MERNYMNGRNYRNMSPIKAREYFYLRGYIRDNLKPVISYSSSKNTLAIYRFYKNKKYRKNYARVFREYFKVLRGE